MKIKKLFKYLPITMMAAGLAVAAATPSISLLNNSDYLKNPIFNSTQQVDETEYTDQLDYIRNDVAKQTGVTNSVASIKIPKSSSLAYNSAALVTKTDGSTLLYMWGDNQYGQLGNGTKTSTSTPTLVDSAPFGSRKITQIALGYNYSAALLDDGSLYTWGRNDYSQLGNGTTTSASTPTPVDSTPFGTNIISQIALGFDHSAALVTETDGSTLLYMWGRNQKGQLGNGTKVRAPIPTLVDSAPFGSRKITQIALGASHSAALLDNDSLYMWGDNEYGQLGNGTTDSASIPTEVIGLDSNKITQIALGYEHSAALITKTDGSTLLYMWGRNNYSQLGFTANNTSNPAPIIVDSTPFGSNKITQIALGGSHSAALMTKTDGSTLLYMWGNNQYGQLGFTANTTSNPTPTLVTTLSGQKITQVTISYWYSTALLDDGSLYMWGGNSSGQLGFTANNTPNPTPTWMSQLGKDSHITAKSAITAQAAVDNIWVDNKFNLTGFKNSFNLTNILETTDQEITMDTKPTYDNATGTVTMTVKIKYFYNEDGLIVANTAAGPMDISGFIKAPTKTNITAKNDSPIVASDEAFMKMIYDADGKLNQVELAKFVDGLDTIPETATILSVDYISTNQGTAIFQIKLSGYYDGTSVNMVNEEKSYDFEVRVEYTAPAVNDGFPWWWIIIGIGGAAIIGVGIWFVIKKRKEAEAKSSDVEPNSEDPKDDNKKTSESEAKSEEAAKTDNHPIDKPAEETKTEEESKPKSLKKTKK